MSSPARRRELLALQEAAEIAAMQRRKECYEVPVSMVDEYLALEDALSESKARAIKEFVKSAMQNWKDFFRSLR